MAGACAAFTLSRDRRVLILEAASEPATQASGAAAGLVNPLMGRRPRLAWRIEEALAALKDLLGEADASDLWRGGGVVRPAPTEKHARAFRQAAEEHPAHAQWIGTDALREQYPMVRAEGGGALLVQQGGAVDVPAMVRALLHTAQERDATLHAGVRVTGWQEDEEGVHVEARQNGEAVTLEADYLMLAPGAGYVDFPGLYDLPLQRIKGQTARVRAPGLSPQALPFLSGSGYVVPDGDALVVGSTYENDFDNLTPSPEQTDYILQKTAQMLPALAEAEIIAERAGARVKVPNSRYPLLDRLPGAAHVWVFTALGSKGLLTAPLLAQDLPQFLERPRRVPDAVQREQQ